MFICEACYAPSLPGEPQNKRVTEVRVKNYYKMVKITDDAGNEYFAQGELEGTGTEIVTEASYCKRCVNG